MKIVTSVRIDAELYQMAKLNNITLSELVENTLRGYLAQYQNEYMTDLRKTIEEREIDLRELKAKYEILAQDRIRELSYEAHMKKKQAWYTWLKEYPDLAKYETETAAAYLEKISKQTGVPLDFAKKIILDNSLKNSR